MAPYFCHIHNGLYVAGDEEGCQHEECVSFRNKDIGPVGVIVANFGGSTVQKQQRAHSKKFHKDMDSYYSAKKQGVQPDQVSSKAAQAALMAKEKEVG